MSGGAVYRFFAADGALLYVGRSVSALARLAQHEAGAPWFDDAVKITIERHPTAEAAASAETAAILSERPRFNKATNPNDARKRSVLTITDTLGSAAIEAALGVSSHSVRFARSAGIFPASWYAPLRDMCDAAGADCPLDAFNWKSVEQSKTSGSNVPSPSEGVS